jgi:hypothetical protein
MAEHKFNDYTKINYNLPRPNKEEYNTFAEYWDAMFNQQDGYLYLKFKDTYNSKWGSPTTDME